MAKQKILSCLLCLIGLVFSIALAAQAEPIREIEPDRETSFENYELLIIAVLGLVILMGLRLWFKRTRRH